MSLIWLPFSVSSDVLLSVTDKDNCHEMSSDYDMSVNDLSINSMSDNSGHSVTSAQIVSFDNSKMNHSMQKKKCCCSDNCVACIGMISCTHSSNHASTFILSNQFFSKSFLSIQIPFQQSVQYRNQIITPDIRPPIV